MSIASERLSRLDTVTDNKHFFLIIYKKKIFVDGLWDYFTADFGADIS